MEVNFETFMLEYFHASTNHKNGSSSVLLLSVLFIKETEPCKGSGLGRFIAPRILLVKWTMGL